MCVVVATGSNNQITGNIGLYYCCYHLSLMGWNVMPTARNTRGIDIVIYNHDFSRFVRIQVKTLSRRNPVRGVSPKNLIGDFWIIVSNAKTSPSAHIMLPSEIAERVKESTKNNKVSYWLQPAQYDVKEFKEAWDRIGSGWR